MADRIDQTDFPRVILKCQKCGNEFQINVLRFREGLDVFCHVCGNKFPTESGKKFAEALQRIYEVKYDLDKAYGSFQFAFIYKSTHAQPPIPYTFTQE
jgi:hypothetical protein